MIPSSEIFDICRDYEEDFITVPYENRGMFNSELFLVVSLCKHYNLRVVESGRARGHSTETIAVNGIDIISIDHASDDDIQYSKKKLKKYKNVKLVYGDSREMVNHYTHQPCFLLEDGMKGQTAIRFVINKLINNNVRFAGVHDLYRPNPDRDYADHYKPFCTDSDPFVDAFRYMDKECWEKLDEIGGIPERPYYRRGKKIESYASTLALFE